METEERMIAACGLDCGRCEIRRAPFDEEAAESVVAWYREQGWLQEDEGMEVVLEKNMYCKGCLALERRREMAGQPAENE